MKRRQILAQIGAGTIVGIAGCIGGAESPNDLEGGNSPDQEANTPSTESDGGKGDTDPENTPIDEQSCPPSETDRDSAVCSHTVDAESAEVYLEPEPEQSALEDGTPVEEITLTLRNQSSSDLRFNPHSWRIWHKDDSGWKEIQQSISGNGHLIVPADNTHSWTLMEAVGLIQEDPELRSGLYAAEIGVPDPENTEEWIACVALVQFTPVE